MFCWSVDEKEWNVQNKKGAWKHGKSRKIRPRLCENFRIRGADRAFPKPVPRQRPPSGKCPSPRREETHRPHFHSRFQKAGAPYIAKPMSASTFWKKEACPFSCTEAGAGNAFLQASCCAPFCFSGFPAAFGTFTLTET